MFDIVSNHKIVGFPDGNIISLCPTIDLLVISMNKMSIWVFRLNGERVYSVNNKSPIIDLCWSPDGKYFAVSGIDNKVKIYDSNNGSLINEFESASIMSLTWSALNQSLDNEELFHIDILSNLPQLSNFTNFNDLTYILTTSNDSISFIFNNLVQFKLPTNFKLTNHTNFDLFHHLFINDKNQLIKFEISFNKHIVDIILIFCKIKLIMNNFQADLSQIVKSFLSFLTLFDRYMGNYFDNLGIECNEGDSYKTVIGSLQNILLTHLIPKKLNDYFLNQFGERGLKRLSKEGNDTYDNIKDTVFKNIIQNFEKLVIVLNNLRGIIHWCGINGTDFGISIQDIDTILTTIKQQIKYFYQLIWNSNEEQKLFNKFLNWFKFLIECLVKENNDEEIKIIPNLHNSDLLSYFNNYLFHSKVNDFLKFDADLDILRIDNTQDLLNECKLLDNSISEGIFTPFEGFFVKSSIFNDAVDLNLSDCQIFNIKNNAFLFSTENHQLSIINVSTMDKKTLKFDKIINYQIFNEFLIILHQSQKTYMEKFSIEQIFNGDLKSLEVKEIDSDKPQLLVVNEVRSSGCLFEGNRKDYSLIKL